MRICRCRDASLVHLIKILLFGVDVGLDASYFVRCNIRNTLKTNSGKLVFSLDTQIKEFLFYFRACGLEGTNTPQNADLVRIAMKEPHVLDLKLVVNLGSKLSKVAKLLWAMVTRK